MTGTIALQGGAPFVRHDELDRRLLASVAADRVVVLPTADAFEDPDGLIEAARTWGERIGVATDAARVLTRADAQNPAMVDVVSSARAVYLVGDSPLHLRSVMKDTPVWAAVQDVWTAGGLIVGVGQSASALCDPMNDPRGGAFTLGLGLISGVALVVEIEGLTPDRLARTLKLADVPLMELPSGAAAIVDGDGRWELVGNAITHGSWNMDSDGRCRPA